MLEVMACFEKVACKRRGRDVCVESFLVRHRIISAGCIDGRALHATCTRFAFRRRRGRDKTSWAETYPQAKGIFKLYFGRLGVLHVRARACLCLLECSGVLR